MREIPRGPLVAHASFLRTSRKISAIPEGGDREVVGAEPNADARHAPGDDRAHDHRGDHARPRRQGEAAQVPLGGNGGHDGGGVGADREEARHPGVEEPRKAPLDVEPEGEHRVDPAHREQEHGVEEDAVELFHLRGPPLPRGVRTGRYRHRPRHGLEHPAPEEPARAPDQDRDHDREGDPGLVAGRDERPRCQSTGRWRAPRQGRSPAPPPSPRRAARFPRAGRRRRSAAAA